MKQFTAVVLALVMVLSLSAAAFAEEGEAPAPPVIKIGIVVPEAESGWIAETAYYAEAYCQEQELDYKLVTAGNAAGMKSALKQLVRWGATAVVMYPQWTELEAAVQEVLDAGITVVNYGMDVGCWGIYKVTGDNYGMGYQSGRAIVDAVGNGAIIAVLTAPNAGAVSESRRQGFYDYLSALGYDTTNVFERPLDALTREDGLDVMTDVLKDYKHLDAVFAMDDEVAMGVLDALAGEDRDDIKIITSGGGCQDYLSVIADEQYLDLSLTTALYSPRIVETAIQAAVNVRNGVWVDEVTTVPTALVSVVNVDEYRTDLDLPESPEEDAEEAMEPVDEPVEDDTEEPVDESMEDDMEEPVDESMEDDMEEPVDESMEDEMDEMAGDEDMDMDMDESVDGGDMLEDETDEIAEGMDMDEPVDDGDMLEDETDEIVEDMDMDMDESVDSGDMLEDEMEAPAEDDMNEMAE